MLKSVPRNITDLVVYNLFVFVSPVEGFEETHNVRILITISESTVIWNEIKYNFLLPV